jgi:hypothetical protein
MPKRRNRGLTVVLDRQYDCAGCGTEYLYRFRVKTSEPEDRYEAEREALEIAAQRVHDVPCPVCVRPDAQTFAAQRRARAPLFILPMLCAAGLVLWQWFFYPLRERAIWFVGPALAAASVMFIVFILSRQSVKHANRKRVEELLEQDKVHSILVTEEHNRPADDAAYPAFAALSIWPVLGTIVVTAIGLAVPHIGSSYNPDGIPGYVSPGRDVEIELPVDMRSVKHYWRGEPELALLNLDEVGGPVQLRGIGSNQTWPQWISVKDDNEAVEQFRPTITVQVPDDQRLVYKSLRVRVTMEITYPELGSESNGQKVYRNVKKPVDEVVSVPVTDATTADSLNTVWWLGAGFAVLCMVVPPVVFAWLCSRSFLDLPPPVISVVRTTEPSERRNGPD